MIFCIPVFRILLACASSYLSGIVCRIIWSWLICWVDLEVIIMISAVVYFLSACIHGLIRAVCFSPHAVIMYVFWWL